MEYVQTHAQEERMFRLLKTSTKIDKAMRVFKVAEEGLTKAILECEEDNERCDEEISVLEVEKKIIASNKLRALSMKSKLVALIGEDENE